MCLSTIYRDAVTCLLYTSGLICRRAAAACDVAVEVTADFPICWKGAL